MFRIATYMRAPGGRWTTKLGGRNHKTWRADRNLPLSAVFFRMAAFEKRERRPAVVRPARHARPRRCDGLASLCGKLHHRHPAQRGLLEQDIEYLLSERLFFPRGIHEGRVKRAFPFPPKTPKLGPRVAAADFKPFRKSYSSRFFLNVAAKHSVLLQRYHKVCPAAKRF